MNDNYVALIVDDNLDYREFLADTLRDTSNFKFIIEASNGIEAFNKLKLQEFHLIILDLHMPKSSGIDFLLKAQKLLKEKKNSKIIVSSAHITEDTIKECITLGAHLFLTKPFNPDFFLEKVFFLLNKKTKRV